MNIRSVLAFALAFSGSLAHAAEPSEMINKATCTKGTDTRELEIVAKGEGHVVSYTKAGAAKEVGQCSMNKAKCEAVFEQIKASLEKAGFACSV